MLLKNTFSKKSTFYFRSKIRSKFTLVVCFLFVIFGLSAQGDAEGYLYVYPSEKSALPSENFGNELTASKNLNSIFEKHRVVEYSKSFPGAKSKMLKNAYEIHLNGDLERLKIALESSRLFSRVEMAPYYELASNMDCPASCSNPFTVNDPNTNYELEITNALCAWNITEGKECVVVGVVDTEFDTNHPDLIDGIISVNGTNTSCPHGSIVSGMIVAKPNNGTGSAGIAPKVKVAGYVVPGNCTGNPWNGVWQAYLDGRQVINVSWTGVGCCPSGQTVPEAITELTENGTVLVVAAGNGDPGDVNHGAYSDIPGVINASSISSDGSLHEWVHYNDFVDICAPGDGVGTVNGSAWGTSLSAPLVAGTAALMLSVNPCLTPSEIEIMIESTACPIANNPFPNWTGAGILDTEAAVEAAQATVPGTQTIPSGATVTWNNAMIESDGIIIETLGTLIIENSTTVNMFSDARITVKRGARLIVDNSVITTGAGGCSQLLTCNNNRWGGIKVWGNANLTQPSLYGTLTTSDAGVVIIRNNSLIEKAGTAISTTAPGLSYPSQVARWGGLVHCENSTFENNRRVCEFMKYDYTNKSKFINCTIEAGTEGQYGVTIWSTDGVTFNRNRFYNLDRDGILVYDAGAIVKDGNDFQHNRRGISARATHPYSAFLEVGDMNTEPNYFLDNWFHIESNASKYGAGMKVVNNEFFESNTALWFIGPARFNVDNNSFAATTAGIYVNNTGGLKWNQHNYIRRNAIQASTGIIARGLNKEMQFLCNNFGSSNNDFSLRGTNGGTQGEIRQYQGNFSSAAGNCFTLPGAITDIQTQNNTLLFNYYIKSGGDLCEIPLSPGNYTTLNAFSAGCKESGGIIETPTWEDYLEVKEKLKSGLLSQDEIAYYTEIKDDIIDKLLEARLTKGDVKDALNLLDEENTIAANQMKYGIQLHNGDYEDALLTLSKLPSEIEEMSTFKEVQLINIDRMKSGLLYEISEKDSVYLESVIREKSSSAGYAQAIMGLLFDRVYEDGVDEEGKEFNEDDVTQFRKGQTESDSQQNDSIKEAIVISPNPISDEFHIQIKSTPVSQLEISSIVGRKIYTQDVSEGTNSLSISSTNWKVGIYVLQLFDSEGKLIHSELISKAK